MSIYLSIGGKTVAEVLSLVEKFDREDLVPCEIVSFFRSVPFAIICNSVNICNSLLNFQYTL